MFKKFADNVSYSFTNFGRKLKDTKNLPAFLRKIIARFLLGIVKYLLIICIAFVFVYPFLYMIITSFKSPSDLADPTVSWIPTAIWKDNYTVAIRGLQYWQGLKNSAIVTLLSTVGHVFSASLAGYGLARYRFKGRSILLVLLVLAIIVPPQVISIPNYILYANLRLLTSYLPIVLPTFFGMGLKGGVFIFIFRQFYTGIPSELEEAARVDGCGPVSTFLRVIVPMSKAPFLVSIVLSIVWHWTDTYESVLYIRERTKMVVIARLPELFSILNSEAQTETEIQNQLIYNEAVVMAATFLVVLPVMIVYFILQRQFTQGIERSGIVG